MKFFWCYFEQNGANMSLIKIAGVTGNMSPLQKFVEIVKTVRASCYCPIELNVREESY